MQTDSEKYNETVQPNTAFLNGLKNKLPEFFNKAGDFDLDKFKSELKKNNVNELSEGYQLNFIGKDYARRQAGEMPTSVIVPDEKQNNGEGKDSKNLFFTGDNLEVLRHLQTAYANKVDVIYIDPPYNTGSDGFVYPDSFEYSDGKLKDMFGLDDDQVERLKSIQGKSSHSAWMTFMYPRLALAKTLLSQNGVLFISIDNNEQANLTELMESIFGEENFVDNLIWKGKGGGQDSSSFVKSYEYVLCYSKNISKLKISSFQVMEDISEFKYFDGNRNLHYKRQLARKWGSNDRREDRPNLYFSVTAPDGSEVYPKRADGSDGCWRHSKERMEEEIRDGEFEFVKKGNEWVLYQKIFANKNGKKSKKYTNIIDGVPAGNGIKRIKNLFEGKAYFDYPKPTALIKRLISMINFNKEPVILDFFAGSSTTADAVMQLNAENCGHRKFIMVQLPEKTYTVNSDGKEVPTKGGKAAYDAGFRSIDEFSRERIRRASGKIKEDAGLTLPENFDGSFKHYRVVSPTKQALESIEDFDPNNTSLFTDMIESFSSKELGVSGDATGEETILTTWLAKDGYSFEADIKKVDFAGYEASLVEDSRLYIIKDGWTSENTKALLNKVGTRQLTVQTIALFGYSFNIADLRELEIGLKQLDSSINLLKRY
ncbi:site-specific DNA-methyltransferase [Limosilactobacillus fermentum]|uniref:site-specific DNA-methyltransferase n=1 Tax=Limosilactobacillus fermentum TaxID=1613 RepID=UPI000C1E53E3|nr:site-specific DNA-methyltransferase [Limosilactobacillus fermentum]PJE93320.1 site-specific DNA-methyltransferase [Limosilactobacillus fermentum]